MYDIIGDIHGNADKLVLLLEKMGYTQNKGSYSHPVRKVLFIGDYIDRGSQIPETLNLVRSMVESDNAIALMGNHEYNAICFNTKNEKGDFMREHSLKNAKQHIHTLRQFQYNEKEYNNYIEWFKTLPLFYETENFRAVHACWASDKIDYLKGEISNDILSEQSYIESGIKGTPMFKAIEDVLKGKEIRMPSGMSFKDKDGHIRSEIRIKWWLNPSTTTIKDLSILPLSELPEKYIDITNTETAAYYKNNEIPVFFGHYWFTGTPEIQQENICCLDYSVAKAGKLVAYRYNNEQKLTNKNFVFV